MQGKGGGPVNRVELESQVLCAALRQSIHVKDKIGAFTSVRELSHLFPDLLPPPEGEDADSSPNLANYYQEIGVKPQSAANGVIASYLRAVRKFLRTQKVADDRLGFNRILNAGFVLRKPRLRLSHDLVVARRWLHEESARAAAMAQEITIDGIPPLPLPDYMLTQPAPPSAPPAAMPAPAPTPPTPSIVPPVPPLPNAARGPEPTQAPPAGVPVPPVPPLPNVMQPAATIVPPVPPLPNVGQPGTNVPPMPKLPEVQVPPMPVLPHTSPTPPMPIPTVQYGAVNEAPVADAPKPVQVPPVPPLPNVYGTPEPAIGRAEQAPVRPESAPAVAVQAPPVEPVAPPMAVPHSMPAVSMQPVAHEVPPAPPVVQAAVGEESAPTVEPVAEDVQPAQVRAQMAQPAAASAAIERKSGRISKEATFVFDESQLRKPQEESGPVPVVIQLLEAAHIIGPLEVQALLAQMKFAPDVPVEKHILNAGYVNSNELSSIKLGESLLQSGKITMAQFQVAIYDERTSGLRMAESLQVRGWLSVEVRNAIDDWQRKRS